MTWKVVRDRNKKTYASVESIPDLVGGSVKSAVVVPYMSAFTERLKARCGVKRTSQTRKRQRRSRSDRPHSLRKRSCIVEECTVSTAGVVRVVPIQFVDVFLGGGCDLLVEDVCDLKRIGDSG